MTEDLEQRVKALERVLTSELPADLRPLWPTSGYRWNQHLISASPGAFLQLEIYQCEWGLELRLDLNTTTTLWRREVRFAARAA